jgi:diguanylate cyclase (GGDEF)-like protein
MATHDPLTGLANRKLFHEMLSLSIARASRSQYTVTLLMIDLNGFKPINDNFGHEVGDQVLIYVSEQLLKSIRRTDLAARLGGVDLLKVLDKIKSAIAEIVPNLAKEINVTASIGVAVYPSHTQLEEELVRFADHAMYFSKKNKVGSKIYTPEVDEFMTELGNTRT